MDSRGMGLVLERQRDERVVIRHASGEELVVTVVELREGRVKLGFLGEKRSFSVHREEVQQRIDRGERRPPRAT